MMQQILVVKIGGGEGLDLAQTCADLASIARQRPMVIVHGVSGMMARMADERGLPVQMLTSPSGHSFRYTNPQTRDLFVEASQRVNDQVRGHFALHGIPTTTVSDCIHGDRKNAIRAVMDGRVRVIRDDYSGAITEIDSAPLFELLNAGLVPVLPPLAFSENDGLLNVDGDRAAATVASALGAETLVILSNVRGLYRDFPNEASFVSHVERHQISSALDWAQGRMKRKVLGAHEALEGGVNRVVIGDGRVPSPVTSALEGQGTVFAS
jgi:acetylglutamate/LysW-gamma-L-alpha-aminoadipate kinase